jgi:hypothetical protein
MYVADFDASKMHFAPLTTGGAGQKQVLVFRDASSTAGGNRVEFQLCPDTAAPLECKYRLDDVKEGQNPHRRGQKVKVTDAATLAALAAIDERIVATAIERSAEWFGRTIPADQVRARYKPIAEVAHDGDDHHTMKITFKGPGAPVPTELFRLDEKTGKVSADGQLEHLELKGARVVPIVSAYALYFLGGGTQFGLSFAAEKVIYTAGRKRDVLAGFVSSTPLELEEPAADEPDLAEELHEAKRTHLTSKGVTTTGDAAESVELEDDYAAM